MAVSAPGHAGVRHLDFILSSSAIYFELGNFTMNWKGCEEYEVSCCYGLLKFMAR